MKAYNKKNKPKHTTNHRYKFIHDIGYCINTRIMTKKEDYRNFSYKLGFVTFKNN